MPSSRSIPSIDALLQRPELRPALDRYGRTAVVDAVRAAADTWRRAPEGDAADAIIAAAGARLAAGDRASLRPVLNATGVLIHTNLGRAPLARGAVDAAAAVSSGYANLEYDLDAGGRGHRHQHAERLLVDLTGADAAVVCNNNAAATLLTLAALAAGREVVVSRGELVEIGGGFRVPEILAQSGATLREVGTTNRTRISDYAAAISDRTGLLLRVHPSNFRIEGFTERPALADLTALGRRFSIPVFEDQGSGWLGLDGGPAWPDALRAEPSVRQSLADGADLVAFSGDKLLGGPQAGLVAGRSALLDRLRRHPLMRALRADKQTYAALEATLRLWRRPPAWPEIPLVRMLLATTGEIGARAEAVANRLRPALEAAVVDGHSTIGGGSAPQSVLPTRLVAASSAAVSAAALEARLRASDPPVIVRVQDDRVLLDLRTVHPEGDDVVTQAILDAVALGN